MTENWIAIAACFTSSILSSMVAYAIAYAVSNKKVDFMQREVNVYKAALASKEKYLTISCEKADEQEKALNDIQEILYGVTK